MPENTKDNTPAHCHDCWKLDECHQAQFMNSNTESVEGFAWDADLYCADCIPNNATGVSPTDNGETDSPDHCASCGVPLHCRLTTDGVGYVRATLEEGGGCCQELWPVLFADYLN